MIHWKAFAGTMLSLALFAPLLLAQQTPSDKPASPAASGTSAQGSSAQGSSSQGSSAQGPSSQSQGAVAKNAQPKSSQPGRSRQIKGSHEACWKQAGIPESAIQQRKSIEETAHSQVQSVCSDSSLNQQQKVQKIRDIRKSTHEQMRGLLSPQQEQALKQCQREHGRAGAHHAGSGASGARAGNPCAGSE